MRQTVKNASQSFLLNKIKKAGFNINKLPQNLATITEYDQYVKIPSWVLESAAKKEISPSALQLYMAIASFCYYNVAFTWVSKNKLAEATGFTARTVYRLLNELVNAGIIYIYTQKTAENTTRSLIFLLSKKNSGLKSQRKKFLAKKDTDTHDSIVLSNLTTAYCHGCHSDTVTGVRRNTTKLTTGDRNYNQAENDTTRLLPRMGARGFPTKNVSSTLNKQLINRCTNFANRYYKFINRKFKLRLYPRISDILNLYNLIEDTVASDDTLWSFIRRHLYDKYFLTTNKHLSVWTGPKYRDLLVKEYNVVENSYLESFNIPTEEDEEIFNSFSYL